MAAGPLHSGMMDFVKAYAINGDPNMLAFAVKNAAKDVGYYAQMADGLNAPSIMSKSAREALTTALEEDWGERFVPEMVDFFVKRFAN